MSEMKMSATFGGDQPPDPRSIAPVFVGVLLVAIGGAMLAERTNLLPEGWRQAIWPVLLVVFGFAQLAVPSRRGRRGLLFVLGGVWWFAGLQGWLSFERTWPLLIVFYGASVVLQGLTSQRALPRGTLPRPHNGLSWVLLAILVGAIISNGGGRNWARDVDARGRIRMVSLMGNSDHRVDIETFRLAEVVTIMGRNTIDLRDLPASAPDIVTIDGLTTMGNTIIRVPRSWTVDLKTAAVMGRARDVRGARANAPEWSDAPTPESAAPGSAAPHRVVVSGLVLMGELRVTE